MPRYRVVVVVAVVADDSVDNATGTAGVLNTW